MGDNFLGGARSRRIARNFSAAATTYERAAVIQVQFAKRLAEAIHRFIQQPESITTIAELGCGTGVLTRRLARCFPRAALEAIDISRTMIQGARAAQPRIPNAPEAPLIAFTEADAEDIAFLTPRDLIASNFCVQWFTNPLASLAHHMKQSRYLAWTLPVNGTFSAWIDLQAQFGYDAKIQAFVEEDELRATLGAAGLRRYTLTIDEAPLEFPDALDFVRHVHSIGAHTARDTTVAVPLQRLLRAAAKPFKTAYRVAMILIEV